MRQTVFNLGAWLWSFWSAFGTVWLVCLGVEVGRLARGMRLMPRLADVPADSSALPAVSVVVAARNEEQAVASCVRSLLASDYPSLEVVAVDDRSSDRTGVILDELAATDPRLRVLRLQELPPGWLGKNHALECGARLAHGEWLLFTDADVRFAPSTIRRAVTLAQRNKLDHVAAVPALLAPGMGLRLFIAGFSLILTMWLEPWNAIRSNHRAYVGLGAFNLVREGAYRSVGGHASLPLAVADDVTLGRLLKSAGFRQCMALSASSDQRLLELEWYPDLGSAVRGLEKNAFAMFDFRTLAVVIWSLAGAVITGLPLFALLVAPGWHRLPWLAVDLLVSASFGAAGRQMMGRFPWFLSLLFPVAQITLTWAVLRSAWLTIWRGGVHWRGTFYPLRELRGGQQPSVRLRQGA